MDPAKIKAAAERFAAMMRGAADVAPHVANMASVTDAIAKGKVDPRAAIMRLARGVKVDATVTVAGVPLRVEFGSDPTRP